EFICKIEANVPVSFSQRVGRVTQTKVVGSLAITTYVGEGTPLEDTDCTTFSNLQFVLDYLSTNTDGNADYMPGDDAALELCSGSYADVCNLTAQHSLNNGNLIETLQLRFK